ncbi:hypothetical protein DY000_02034703 [Brassica cretica]|uniref:Uncharacterized protein n=1 Tax=Brassica cretica TaxID=69181 RepID=A0ABQ7DUB2_BRACR|nr:hypothetical protein DY000_02034703 [Brassica cretica]
MHFNSANRRYLKGYLENTADLSSNRLSVSSFWGLFLIAGVASFLALLVFVALFLVFDEKDIRSHTFKSSAVHNVSSPITQCTPSHLTLQIGPWPRSMSLSREFELRKACFVMSEERFRTQPKHDKVGESDIESGAE